MLANRQPDSADPSQWAYEIKHEGFRLVAVEHCTILAVGEVILSYVSPDARFRGVSRVLLSALENRGGRTRQYAVHTQQHRDSASLLPSQWLRRRRPPGWQIWYLRELRDVVAAYDEEFLSHPHQVP